MDPRSVQVRVDKEHPTAAWAKATARLAAVIVCLAREQLVGGGPQRPSAATSTPDRAVRMLRNTRPWVDQDGRLGLGTTQAPHAVLRRDRAGREQVGSR
jgi:hypothetical protein